MKKLIASFLVVVACTQLTWAQSDLVRPASIGVSFTLTDYRTANLIRTTSLSTVVRDKSWSSFSQMEPGLMITYFKGLTKNIDFAGSMNLVFSGNPIPNRTSLSNAVFLEGDASFNFKMLPDNYWVSPYLIAGIGGSRYNNYYGAFIPVGGGLKVNFSDEATLFITQQYRIPVTTETNSHRFLTTFGVAGIVGKRKEVEVKAATPPPPVDTDGDGIPDGTDQCPTVPGTVKYNGCPVPDTDKDGINDEQDQCPTVPGTAKYKGCPVPDTDKDGINDEEDKCPSVAGVARYQGCPVPDTDKDGVNDEEDKCPTVPGTVANNGCPEVKQDVVNRVNYAAKNIFFVTGSAKLSAKSNPALDEVAKILSEDSNLKLSIGGHTDNVGKADFNQTLSEKRANAVRDYLLKKGVSESRLTAAGFGSTQPVADNKTAAGRAKNRRVELKLDY